MTRYTLHYHRDATALIRQLGERGSRIREAIRRLADQPRPQQSRQLPDEPGLYEIEESGYWIGYHVDDEEEIIRVLMIEPVNG